MPEAARREYDKQYHSRFYSSFVQTYLERDVSTLDGVRNLGEFELFFRLLAGRTGQLVNFANLAREVGVAPNTIREWVTILEKGFHIYLLKPYFHNFSKRLVKSPKIYFLDSGLQAYLTGWSDPETTLHGPMAGHMFENWVVSNLLRSYLHRGRDAHLFFWRTRTGEEFDLWVPHHNRIDTVEIKLSTKLKPEYFAPLRYIDPQPETFGTRLFFSMASEVLQVEKNLWNIPVVFIN
jgi:predicted AAA+ superfamily ATPase